MRQALHIAVIGGGPAGLMAAETISRSGYRVHVYDAMPSVGRKFLMAGKGGLNITHSENFDQFIKRYHPVSALLSNALNAFTPEDLRAWVQDLGITTFIGSSGRVFPEGMKAAPLLRAWLHRLRQADVHFHVRHRWLGWQEGDPHRLIFATPLGENLVHADATVLALGGASWPQLGSTGTWVEKLSATGIKISPLLPANCGFNAAWSDMFRSRFAGQPLKSVAASFQGVRRQGDCVITDYGIEGGLIYAFSSALRGEITQSGATTLLLDLTPNTKAADLSAQLAKPRGGQSFANHLRKKLRLDPLKQSLLREAIGPNDGLDADHLCAIIKALPITLTSPRPVAEAISSAGGICFDMLDNKLMLNALPGVFCAGEMLDWDAPTGGYLLTACFASGLLAGNGVSAWLNRGS